MMYFILMDPMCTRCTQQAAASKILSHCRFWKRSLVQAADGLPMNGMPS